MSSDFKSLVVTGDFCPWGDIIANCYKQKPLDPHAGIWSAFGTRVALITNLECPFTNAKFGKPDKWANLKASPNLSWMLDGIAVATIGNNHIGDFGSAGIRDTTALLDAKQIKAPGYGNTLTAALRPVHITVDSQTLGIVSLCCPTTNSENIATHQTAGVAPIGMAIVQEAIEKARNTCDVLLVYLHWGCEWVHDPTLAQLRLARHAIDCGADAVVGCHSHTIQSYETYKDRWIFYGLGNYLFGQGTRQEISSNGRVSEVISTLEDTNRESLAVEFAIEATKTGSRLVLQKIQPMVFSDDWLPKPVGFRELTVDVEKQNGILAQYVQENSSRLLDREEPIFRSKLRNGVLAYWYMDEPIKYIPKRTLLRRTVKNMTQNLRHIRRVRSKTLDRP